MYKISVIDLLAVGRGCNYLVSHFSIRGFDSHVKQLMFFFLIFAHIFNKFVIIIFVDYKMQLYLF